MHSCPECDQACFCGGDIDDFDTCDEQAEENCTHCAEGNYDDDQAETVAEAD